MFEQLAPGQQPPTNETAQAQELRLQRGYRASAPASPIRATAGRMPPRTSCTNCSTEHCFRHRLTRALLALMKARTRPSCMRQGLPHGVQFADKCGPSCTLDGLTATYNDIGS